MTDIVFMTAVGQNVFSDPWNQTDDIFEEHEPGLGYLQSLITAVEVAWGSYSCFNWSSEVENE